MSMKPRLMIALGASAALLLPAPAFAQQPSPDATRLLQQQIDDMRKQLYDLEAKLANTSSEFQKQPQIELSNGRLGFKSRDGSTSIQFEGRMHLDWANYSQKTPAIDNRPAEVRDLNSGTNIRRARLGVSGTFAKDFEFALIGEWGASGTESSSLDEASLAWKGWKPFSVKIGAFKPSGALDEATSDNDVKFIERATAASLQASLAGGTARKGIEIGATGERYLVRAALTGEVYGNSEQSDEQTGITARVAGRPIANEDMDLHLGVNAAFIVEPAQNAAAANANARQSFRLRDRPELRVDSDRLIDTGDVPITGAQSYGLEAALRYKGFLVQGEYVTFALDRRNVFGPAPADVDFESYYVQASYVLTGESFSYNTSRGGWSGVRPRANFKPGSAPGAWEIAVRYSVTDLNDAPRTGPIGAGDIRGGEQEILTIGLNWYLNRNVRFLFNYLNVDIDRLNAAGTAIGQRFDAYAVRTQFTF
jgi:phosphate-selective porin OprO/OprP